MVRDRQAEGRKVRVLDITSVPTFTFNRLSDAEQKSCHSAMAT